MAYFSPKSSPQPLQIPTLPDCCPIGNSLDFANASLSGKGRDDVQHWTPTWLQSEWTYFFAAVWAFEPRATHWRRDTLCVNEASYLSTPLSFWVQSSTKYTLLVASSFLRKEKQEGGENKFRFVLPSCRKKGVWREVYNAYVTEPGSIKKNSGRSVNLFYKSIPV